MTGPNILLITADQWRGDALGALGHMVRTPNLDALAAEGTLFARHYAACAPCSPARASLYTGLHQMTHRVIWNGSPLDDRFDNMARAACRAGYLPILFGYTDTAPDPRSLHPADPALTTYEGVLPGFYQRQALPEDDKPWLSWLAARGHEVDPATVHHVAPEAGETISCAPTRYGAEETQTAFLTGEFLRWLGEQEPGRPWFAHVSYLRPHPPFAVPAPYNALYDPEALSAPIGAATAEAAHPFVAAFREAHLISGFVPGATGSIRDLTRRDVARLRALYYGMITEVDAQIGRLIEGLRASGAYDESLVVVTSDHGEMLGDHGMFGKGGFFEQSYRIPLIVRPPGGGAGATVEDLTSATDVFPTLCEVMGVAPTHRPGGMSLLPALRGEDMPRRTAVIWEYDFSHALPEADRTRPGGGPEECVFVCRRTPETLYVHSPAFGSILYDCEADGDCLAPLDLDGADTLRGLRAAEALLADRARLADRSLAERLVWEWAG